ncbi:histamine H2 receptor-like [Rhopilema esculentum]|uniref:histamine H2 receptor-like n=1 Tax=Rhopilema esculentum TaxID=499914 RepID=UPI0031D49115
MVRENGTAHLCLSLAPNNLGEQSAIITGAIIILFAFFNILSNSLLIFALYKSKQLRTFSNKFILIMTVSDLCLGVFTQPVTAAIWISSRQRNCLELKSVEFMVIFLGYISALMILLISVDRYLHVTKPARYRMLVNAFRMKLSVVLSAVLAFCFALIFVINTSFYQHTFLTIVNNFMMLCFAILNTKTLKSLERHEKNTVLRLKQDKSGQEASCHHKTAQLTAIKTIRWVMAAFFIFYLPYNIVSIVWTYFRFQLKVEPGMTLNALYQWTYLILFSGTFINSWIIIRGNTKCRRVILSILQNKSVGFE